MVSSITCANIPLISAGVNVMQPTSPLEFDEAELLLGFSNIDSDVFDEIFDELDEDGDSCFVDVDSGLDDGTGERQRDLSGRIKRSSTKLRTRLLVDCVFCVETGIVT